jgi:hypothetical protein
MKHCGCTLVGVALLALSAAAASAQVLRPVDPTKRADDVEGKDLQFGSAEFKTITTDTREMGRSSVSDKAAVLKGDVAGLKRLELQTLDLGTVTRTNLPFKNFTAKRAAVTDKVRLGKDLNDVRQAVAPILQRQIRPFTPGGEEELKNQLNKPPLSVRE